MKKLLVFPALLLLLASCERNKYPKVNCGDPPAPYTPAIRYVDMNTGEDMLHIGDKVTVWQPCSGSEQLAEVYEQDSVLFIGVHTGLYTRASNTSPCNILYITAGNMDTDTLEFIGEYLAVTEGSKDCSPHYDFVVSKLLYNGVEAEAGWFSEQHRYSNQYFILKK